MHDVESVLEWLADEEFDMVIKKDRMKIANKLWKAMK